MTRPLSRWLMSVASAALALVAINLLVTSLPVQGRPAAATLNCAGSIQAFGNVISTSGVSSGGHSLMGDPKFVDPPGGDYHLRFGSAAIDRGVDAGVYIDLDGQPRPVGAGFDIGAYESQAIKVLYLPLIYKH